MHANPMTVRNRRWLGSLVVSAALLVAGCAIAALVQTLLPRQWFLALGGRPTLSILALMLFGYAQHQGWNLFDNVANPGKGGSGSSRIYHK